MNNGKHLGVWISLALAAALIILATSISRAQAPTDAQGDPTTRQVVIAMAVEPDSLYVYSEETNSNKMVLNALMDGPFTHYNYQYQTRILTRVPDLDNGDQAIRTQIVTNGAKVVDNNGDVITLTLGAVIRATGCHNDSCAITYGGGPVVMDQMVITYTMRHDLRWSDGVELTHHDAIFGNIIACNLVTPGDHRVCERTSSYSVVDVSSVVWAGIPGYMNREPSSSYWIPLPYHALSTTSASEILNGSYGQHPLGWGPFRIVEWVAGDHITVERNPYYWRSSYPKLDRVTFRFMSEPDEVYQAMLRGEIHLAAQNTLMANEHITDLLSAEVLPTARLLWTPSAFWEHIDFGIQPADDRYAVFSNTVIRQAVAHAIDRQSLVDQEFYGLSAVAHAYIPEDHPLYTALTTYSYNPTQANGLLTGAGWVDSNSNGIRDKDGHEFIITYTTTNTDIRQRVGAQIQADLAAVGIQVNLNFISSSAFFAPGPGGPISGRKFDMAAYAWLASNEPTCNLYLSSEIPMESNGWEGQNYSGYSNPDYDSLCGQTFAALPGTSDYVAAHRGALLTFAADLPVLPLFQRLNTAAASAGFYRGPTLDATEFVETANIWEWDVTARATASPATATALHAPNHILTGTFAAGAFTTTTLITYTHLLPMPTPANLIGVARFFALDAATETDGQPIEPGKAYTLTITYAQASVPTNVVESTLRLYYWNGASWELEPTSQVDVVANLVTANPTHFSKWAVLGGEGGGEQRIYLPLLLR